MSGWTRLRVTRSCERFPGDFELEMTEIYPGQAQDVILAPGDECVLMLDSEPVITGYVDRVTPSISDDSHEIHVNGRGKCEDLLDCAAIWPNGQMSNVSAYTMAKSLAAAYGIDVSCDVPDLLIIPQLNVGPLETVYEVVERVARYSALLVYEDRSGNMVLARAGTEAMTSGVQEGINVEAATAARSMDRRYSHITVQLTGSNNMTDLTSLLAPHFTATDPNVPRRRERVIIAECGELGWEVGKQRAIWEVAWRRGRAEVIHVTVDNWRDVAGNLWEPNKLIDVLIPSLKVSGDQAGTVPQRLMIAEVTYSLDESGTHAQLTLMPPEAFEPKPILLYPQYGDLVGTVPLR
ncbi:Mu P family protein [Pandoraea apista]|nr:Mu P family protein [Pandoraea apista]RRJ81535.1 Mu P family protein [Pandoraea apista]RSD08237.1 Mu P family protein [Pandoraea apista]RSD16724.1 Mu P family protein [Pandoraea apista]RSK87612.1 Mu P family protein [Pandoraea apista]